MKLARRPDLGRAARPFVARGGGQVQAEVDLAPQKKGLTGPPSRPDFSNRTAS
jgi:hypothetical protein